MVSKLGSSKMNSQVILGFLVLFVVTGCDAPLAQYSLDLVYMRKQERDAEDFTEEQKQDVSDILTAMFGTPDEPHVPGAMGAIVDADRLSMTAGPVASDRAGRARGLYRQHCAHCHGVSGDGKGPTAQYLNPYPRDYRMGVFKFKATPKGRRPRREDLRRILDNGVAGTSMPSFKLLPESEREALIDHVIYLSVRGEVERALYEEMASELDVGERLLNDDTQEETAALVLDILDGVVTKWADSESSATPIPPRPDWDEQETLASIERGKQLFYGAVANCTKCHGTVSLAMARPLTTTIGPRASTIGRNPPMPMWLLNSSRNSKR